VAEVRRILEAILDDGLHADARVEPWPLRFDVSFCRDGLLHTLEAYL